MSVSPGRNDHFAELRLVQRGDEFHATAVTRAFQNVLSNVLFRSSAHPRYLRRLREDGSASHDSASCARGLGCGLMRARQALAGASTPAYFLVQAMWWHTGGEFVVDMLEALR